MHIPKTLWLPTHESTGEKSCFAGKKKNCSSCWIFSQYNCVGRGLDLCTFPEKIPCSENLYEYCVLHLISASGGHLLVSYLLGLCFLLVSQQIKDLIFGYDCLAQIAFWCVIFKPIHFLNNFTELIPDFLEEVPAVFHVYNAIAHLFAVKLIAKQFSDSMDPSIH